MRKAVLIASAKSRRGPETFRQARELLQQRGVRVVEAFLEPNKKAVRKRVRAAIAAGRKLICVACGDGGQTFVMREFANSKAILGVLPAGTGNSFALSLGIDGLTAAVEAIAAGKPARVDLGIANGKYFANFATIGLSSEVAEATPHGLKKLAGPIAYGVAALGPLLTHPPFTCRVTSKGKAMRLQTHQVIVANGRFYGHQPIAADATLVDGKLSFFAAEGSSTWDAARTYLALLRGTQESLPAAQAFSAKKITIAATPAQSVCIDGGALCETPVRFEIARRALRVMVPDAFGRGADAA